MNTEPPISRHEFYDSFHGKVSSCQGILFSESSLECECGFYDAVDRTPQRIKLSNQASQEKRYQVWGIVAREKKSRLRMITYVVLTSIPGYIFFFLWLFAWDHESLQDASSLLVLIPSFWAILFPALMV